jgi:hypothetical protein
MCGAAKEYGKIQELDNQNTGLNEEAMLFIFF